MGDSKLLVFRLYLLDFYRASCKAVAINCAASAKLYLLYKEGC